MKMEWGGVCGLTLLGEGAHTVLWCVVSVTGWICVTDRICVMMCCISYWQDMCCDVFYLLLTGYVLWCVVSVTGWICVFGLHNCAVLSYFLAVIMTRKPFTDRGKTNSWGEASRFRTHSPPQELCWHMHAHMHELTTYLFATCAKLNLHCTCTVA